MADNPIAKLREVARDVADGKAGEQETRVLGQIILDMIPEYLFEVFEGGANGWTVATEEIVGRHCYVLFRTLPDDRVAHLSLRQVHGSVPMAQVMAEDDMRHEEKIALETSMSKLERSIEDMRGTNRGLQASVDALGASVSEVMGGEDV